MSSIADAPLTKESSIVVAFRIPRKMHAKLAKIARTEDRSLASIIRKILAKDVH